MTQQVTTDPVHMDPDGQWYFYDETWAARYGPYPDHIVAREQLNAYAEYVTQRDAPAVPQQLGDMDIAVAEYLRLRDLKAEISARHKVELAEVETDMDKGEAYLLGRLNDLGIDSFKVAAGTVYTQTQLRAGLPDKDALMNHIRTTGEVELLQSRVSSTVLKDWMERNNGACPPGVSASFERVVAVRRK